MMATASVRLENPSGAPRRFQCVATVGGSCGKAQTETAAASAATTRPNQRLRILVSLPAETGHEVPHDFLKDSGIQPVPDELALALGGDEVRRLEHPQVVRHGRERDGELLGELAPVRSFSVSSSRILRRVGSARARNSESSMDEIFIQVSKYCQVGAQHAAPVLTCVD